MQILEIPAHQQPPKTVELDNGVLSCFIFFFFDKFKHRNMISFFLERYQPLAIFSLHESRGTWHLQPVKWHLLKRQLLIHIRILFARLESVCLCASKVDNVCASA